MKNAEILNERIKRVLVQDKISNPQRLSQILKEEIVFVLKSYMEIVPNSTKISITVEENGLYDIQICSNASRIYNIKQ